MLISVILAIGLHLITYTVELQKLMITQLTICNY